MNQQLLYPFIQIAGIRGREDLIALREAGIRYAGFPFVLDTHDEDITLSEAALLLRDFPEIMPILITYSTKAGLILDMLEVLNSSIVQLHGEASLELIDELKMKKTELFVIKSIIISDNSLEDYEKFVISYESHADAFITDTYDATTGASGATGKTHDWAISRRIVTFSRKPVILAGGLTPENVAGAVARVKPFGIDSHTGVEGKEGFKSRHKVYAFAKNARRAYEDLK